MIDPPTRPYTLDELITISASISDDVLSRNEPPVSPKNKTLKRVHIFVLIGITIAAAITVAILLKREPEKEQRNETSN